MHPDQKAFTSFARCDMARLTLLQLIPAENRAKATCFSSETQARAILDNLEEGKGNRVVFVSKDQIIFLSIVEGCELVNWLA